jgi:hypothetical protein
MHWSLDDLLSLPSDYYEVLMEIAPKWLSSGSDTEP